MNPKPDTKLDVKAAKTLRRYRPVWCLAPILLAPLAARQSSICDVDRPTAPG
jgi:hypothetical protein